MSIELTEKELERLSSAMAAASSSMSIHSKSETAQYAARLTAEKKLIKELKTLAGFTDEAARAMVVKIRAEEAEAKFAEEKFKKEKLREEKIVEGFKKTYEGLKQFAGGTISSAQSVYNSESAFTAVIPTMNLLGDTVKNTMSAFSSFASGIPILGGIIEGINKTTQIAVDVTMKVMTMQLDAIQKMVGDFNNMSKAGVNFGGQLDNMRDAAENAGMGMHDYTKFVTSNIENLSKLSNSLELSARNVGVLAYRVRQVNPGLYSMYGNLNDFTSAVADYASIMSGYGIDVTKNTKSLNTGAKEYLYHLKELSALTGKNIGTLKKEEEARNKFAAYQIEKGQLDTDNQRINVEKALDVVSARYAPVAGKFGMEYFTNRGKVMSPEGIMFETNNRRLAQLIKDQIDLARQKGITPAEFMKTQGEMIAKATPELVAKANEEQQKWFSNLVLSDVKNPILEMQNSVNSAIIASSVAGTKAAEAAATIIGNRITAEESNKLLTTEGKLAGTAVTRVLDAMNEYNQNMDKRMLLNIDRIGDIVKNLIAINDKLFGNEFTQAIFNTAVDKFGAAVDKLITELGGASRPAPSSDTLHTDQLGNTSGSADTSSGTTNTASRFSLGVGGGATIVESLAEKNRAAREAAGQIVANQTAAAVVAKLNIPVKGNEYTERGVPNEKLTLALNAIYDRFGKPGNWLVTAGNDLEHTKGAHPENRAADIKVRGFETRAQLDILAREINLQAKEAGIKGKAEVHEDVDLKDPKKKTGRYHLHYSLSPEELASLVMESNDRVVASQDRTGDLVEQLLRKIV